MAQGTKDIDRVDPQSGQIFVADTGSNATAAQTSGACLFNPSSVKNLFVFGIRLVNSGSGQGMLSEIRKVTTNPAFSNVITPVNSHFGSSIASLASTSWQASASPTGTPLNQSNQNNLNTRELLSNGLAFLLPANVNSGLVVYVQQSGAGGIWSVMFAYKEY